MTIYGAPGQVTAAFTIVPGRALAENPTPESASEGVRRDDLAGVASSHGSGGTAPSSSANARHITYDREQFVVASAYGVHSYHNVVFYQGGRPITDTAALYDAVGRPDDAQQFRSQAATARSRALMGVTLGSVGLAGALTFGMWALLEAGKEEYVEVGTDTDGYAIHEWRDTGSAGLPLALTGASIAVAIGGAVLISKARFPRRLGPDEATSLVDQYNTTLSPRTAARRPRVERLVVAPSVTSTGGGLTLAGAF